MSESFDLQSTVVHLGRGSTAVPVGDADWSQEWLGRYEETFAADGDDGRMVCVFPQPSTWTTWRMVSHIGLAWVSNLMPDTSTHSPRVTPPSTLVPAV